MDKELEQILDAIGLTIDDVKKAISVLKALEVGKYGGEVIMQLLQVKQMCNSYTIKSDEAKRISTMLINNFTRTGYQSGALTENAAKEWEERLFRIAGIPQDEPKN